MSCFFNKIDKNWQIAMLAKTFSMISVFKCV